MSSEELIAGNRLGRFELVRRLAMGGMAEVWLAVEHADGAPRPVALKVLLTTYASDPAFRAMFIDEVHIASLLAHENIVEVYGGYELDGRLVQAMEVLEGKDLRRLLSALVRSGARLPVPAALFIAERLAAALAYAHERRGVDGRPLEIVHRDVSPHNVFVAREGRVKLLDFGIASAADRLTRTRTGVIKGKLSYMAPEQALGVGVTARTDVFALGVVLWEMLSMKRLFGGGSDAEIVERVVRAEAPPIRAENPAVPEVVEALLGRCLAARAIDRPGSMREVEASLRSARQAIGELATPEAVRAWFAPWVEVEARKTGKFPVAAAPVAPEVAPDPAADATLAGDRTLAEIPRPTERDTLPVELQSAHPTPSFGTGDPTQPMGYMLRAPLASPARDSAESPRAEGARLPTHTEIVRAVDSVTTQPIAFDATARASLLAAMPPRVSPVAPTISSPLPGPKSTSSPAGGEVPSRPRPARAGTPLPVSSQDPTALGLGVLPELASKPRAIEAKTAPTDEGLAKPRALDVTVALADEAPPPPRAGTPSWVYPTIGACLVVIVLLLWLLIMKGK